MGLIPFLSPISIVKQNQRCCLVSPVPPSVKLAQESQWSRPKLDLVVMPQLRPKPNWNKLGLNILTLISAITGTFEGASVNSSWTIGSHHQKFPNLSFMPAEEITICQLLSDSWKFSSTSAVQMKKLMITSCKNLAQPWLTSASSPQKNSVLTSLLPNLNKLLIQDEDARKN